MDEKYLTHAVIQSGYCLFGAGSSASAAYEDATHWLEPRKSDNEPYTADMVENECREFQFDGDLKLIHRNDDSDTFDSYMRSQGGFVFDGTGWTNE